MNSIAQKPIAFAPDPIINLDTNIAIASAPPTAAVAIKLIESWIDLTAQKRRDLTSAISTCCRVAGGMPPEMLILTPEHLRIAVVTKSPAIWDMKAESKSNVLSRLREVLRRLGVIDSPAKTLSPTWGEMRELATDRARMSLAAFMAYCSAEGVVPADVSDAHLGDFEAWLSTRTVNGEPRNMVGAARRAWNQMAKSSDAWPNTILSLASARGQLLLPFSACPASFNEDVEVYKEKLKGQNLDEFFGITIEGDAEPDAFDEIAAETLEGFGRTSGAVLLRPETVKSKVDQIKAAFNALHRAGVPLSEITSLASLVTPLDRPRMIMSQLLRENGGNTKPVIGHVADMLRQLAKYHVKLPPKHVAKLAEWAKKVRFGYHEMTGRNRKMLAQIYTPQRLNTLRNMPDALMDRADKLRPSFRGAVAARRAAMLVLLTRAPMRLGNLLTLRFDEHLVRPDPKTKRISAIVIDADETKNRQGLTYALSERTSAILQRWITEFRPLLTSAGNPYLFGGKGVQPMTRAGIRDTVKAITFECLGVPINPHLFRHLAATVYLEACPGGFEDVRRLLGHKTLQTTTRAYTRIENEASVKRFDKILDDIDETMGLALKPAKKCRPKPKHAAKRPTPNRS